MMKRIRKWGPASGLPLGGCSKHWQVSEPYFLPEYPINPVSSRLLDPTEDLALWRCRNEQELTQLAKIVGISSYVKYSAIAIVYSTSQAATHSERCFM